MREVYSFFPPRVPAEPPVELPDENGLNDWARGRGWLLQPQLLGRQLSADQLFRAARVHTPRLAC